MNDFVLIRQQHPELRKWSDEQITERIKEEEKLIQFNNPNNFIEIKTRKGKMTVKEKKLLKYFKRMFRQ